MIRYTKEYIQQLLDRFMNGETTMEEEDVLSEYFRQADVPAEWRDYQAMFAEWQPKEQPSHRWHWLTAAAAAVLLIVLYVAVSQRQPETSGLAKVPEPRRTQRPSPRFLLLTQWQPRTCSRLRRRRNPVKVILYEETGEGFMSLTTTCCVPRLSSSGWNKRLPRHRPKWNAYS